MLFKKKMSFEEKVKKVKYDRIYKMLQEVLDTSVTKIVDKEQVVDYEATCSAIKTKVRLVKDFIDGLSVSTDKEQTGELSVKTIN